MMPFSGEDDELLQSQFSRVEKMQEIHEQDEHSSRTMGIPIRPMKVTDNEAKNIIRSALGNKLVGNLNG
jgi:hypothetical protein